MDEQIRSLYKSKQYDKIVDLIYDNFDVKYYDLVISILLKKYANQVIKIDAKNYFIIIICKTENEIYHKLLIIYSLLYSKINFSIKKFVGIDYEYNQWRNYKENKHTIKVATCQLAFFPPKKYKLIWIFNPTALNNEMNEKYINLVMLNQKVYKILHGADSLDVPYIYHDLLKNDLNKIILFNNKFYDTRFVCEYHKTLKNEKQKCSIYDALLAFDAITKNKFDELMAMDAKVEPLWKYMWDLNKLHNDKNHVLYALYDVLYLKKLLNNSVKLYHDKTMLYLISDMNRFVLLERHKIIQMIDELKETNERKNNYYINDPKGKAVKLIDIFEKLISKTNIKQLLEITYFKSLIKVLLKHLIYEITFNTLNVYMVGDKPYIEKKNIDLYKILEKYNLKILIKFLKKFSSDATINIAKITF